MVIALDGVRRRAQWFEHERRCLRKAGAQSVTYWSREPDQSPQFRTARVKVVSERAAGEAELAGV